MWHMENIEIVAHKEIIVVDATAGMTDNQRRDLMRALILTSVTITSLSCRMRAE